MTNEFKETNDKEYHSKLFNLISSPDNNIVEWSIARKRKKFEYRFTVLNGAFEEQVAEYSFSYFRLLNEYEIEKFIMRSLYSHSSNYKWNSRTKKFDKELILYG